MIKCKLIVAGLLFPFFISCTKVTVKEIYIDNEDLSSFYLARSGTTLIKEAPKYCDFAFISGGLVGIYRRPKSDYPVLHLQHMDGTPLADFIHKGQGVNQMLVTQCEYNQQYVFLRDPILKKAVLIDTHKSMTDSSYAPVMNKLSIETPRVIPCAESLAAINVYSYKSTLPRVLISDKQWRFKEPRHGEYWAGNALNGQLVYSQDVNKIAYCMSHEPIIEILDGRGAAEKRIVFPVKGGTIMEVPHDGIIEPIYLNGSPSCFLTSAGNNKWFATVLEIENRGHVVLIIKWDGVIVDGFLSDYTVELISCDNDTVYCWETDGNTYFLNKYLVNYEI